MTDTLYGFNSSEDVIRLQSQYALFKRVCNILFQITVEDGFDRALMKEAIDRLIERNDCLRLTFVKKGKETLQYFARERKTGEIPYRKFSRPSDMERFIRSFRKKVVSPYKGKTLETVFAEDPSGKQCIIFKISHFVADTFAIGLLVNDLFSVYKALESGAPMPPAPGRFEDVLKKDLEYKSNEAATGKDREFFLDFYTRRNTVHPSYCGLHGFNSDRWLKYRAKGMFSLPYLMVRCDTEGYRFTIPAAVTVKAADWCRDNGITLSCFFFYCLCVAASVVNGKEKYQIPLNLLNCRGTLAENRCGGTKVQSMSVYTTVDYDKSFLQNIKEMQDIQNELYRHTRLSYLVVEQIQHKSWNYSMLSSICNFAYSYIPMTMPEGIKVQMHSNGKGALVAYIALVHDVRTNEIDMAYDIQTRMITPQQLVDFQNLFIHVVETAVSKPDIELNSLY